MFTGSTLSRSKGFILPVALILMAFGTTMILTAGVMLQRTSSKLNSYSLLSDLRIASNNLVESATMVLADKWSTADLFVSEWPDDDKFHSFVSSRGGYEGTLWAKAIEELDDDSWWLISNDADFKAILDDDAFSELDKKGAAVNRTGNRYSIVSWVEKAGVMRYSYGLAMTESLAGLAALTLGELSRVFYEVTTVDGELTEEFGDLINGAATIFSEVLIHGTDETLTKIFPFGLTAESVSASPSNETIEFESYTDTETNETYFVDLLAEMEEWIQSLTRIATFTEEEKTLSLNVQEEDTLVVFGLPNDLFGTKEFNISFPGKTTDDVIYASYEYLDSKSKSQSVTVSISGNGVPVNLLFYGDVNVIGNAQQLSYVNGRYDITALGDISLKTNLVYGDFSTEIASATGNQGGTLTNPIKTWTSIKSLLTEFSNRPEGDHVVFKALGGDIYNYLVQGGSGTSTHGIRALAGDYYALEKDTEGGSFVFPDMDDLQNIMNGQLYIFGSLTGNRFDPLDQLRNIYNLFVSSPQNSDGGFSTTRRLVLMGLRAW